MMLSIEAYQTGKCSSSVLTVRDWYNHQIYDTQMNLHGTPMDCFAWKIALNRLSQYFLHRYRSWATPFCVVLLLSDLTIPSSSYRKLLYDKDYSHHTACLNFVPPWNKMIMRTKLIIQYHTGGDLVKCLEYWGETHKINFALIQSLVFLLISRNLNMLHIWSFARKWEVHKKTAFFNSWALIQ